MTGRWTFIFLGLAALLVLVAVFKFKERVREEVDGVSTSKEKHVDQLDERGGAVNAIRDGGYVSVTRSPLYLDERLFAMGGDVDIKNDYLLTVMVSTEFGSKDERRCSGIAIAPHLVLTAGHCVCVRPEFVLPKEGNIVIGSAECARDATVRTVLYKPQKEGVDGSPGSTRSAYAGVVRPHPDFKLIIGNHGEVLSSKADLAVIQLDKSVDVDVRLVPIADIDVSVGESVVIVGYDYDEVANTFGRDRRFSKNKVTRLSTSDDERVRVEQPGGHIYRQDSGGPCLRKVEKGWELVGVSSRNLGAGATFASTYPYRAWLHNELRRVSKREPSIPKDPMK